MAVFSGRLIFISRGGLFVKVYLYFLLIYNTEALLVLAQVLNYIQTNIETSECHIHLFFILIMSKHGLQDHR